MSKNIKNFLSIRTLNKYYLFVNIIKIIKHLYFQNIYFLIYIFNMLLPKKIMNMIIYRFFNSLEIEIFPGGNLVLSSY